MLRDAGGRAVEEKRRMKGVEERGQRGYMGEMAIAGAEGTRFDTKHRRRKDPSAAGTASSEIHVPNG